MSEFTDKELQCRDCKQPFTFSAGEQEFFEKKQFHPPARCKPCRDIRKAQKEAEGG